MPADNWRDEGGDDPRAPDEKQPTLPFERPYTEVLSELTDTEALMLGVGMLLLLQLGAVAKDQVPEDRYNATLVKLADDLYTRAMRRF